MAAPFDISPIYQFGVNKFSSPLDGKAIQFTHYDITPIDQTSTALPYLQEGREHGRR
jgi:hypothetical protein